MAGAGEELPEGEDPGAAAVEVVGEEVVGEEVVGEEVGEEPLAEDE